MGKDKVLLLLWLCIALVFWTCRSCIHRKKTARRKHAALTLRNKLEKKRRREERRRLAEELSEEEFEASAVHRRQDSPEAVVRTSFISFL